MLAVPSPVAKRAAAVCQGPLERRKVKLAMLVWAWSMAAAAPGMVRRIAAPGMVRQGAAVPASLARLVVRREAAAAVAKLAAAVLAVASPVGKRAAAVFAAKPVRRAAAARLLQSAQTAPGPSSIASTGFGGSTLHFARP